MHAFHLIPVQRLEFPFRFLIKRQFGWGFHSALREYFPSAIVKYLRFASKVLAGWSLFDPTACSMPLKYPGRMVNELKSS